MSFVIDIIYQLALLLVSCGLITSVIALIIWLWTKGFWQQFAWYAKLQESIMSSLTPSTMTNYTAMFKTLRDQFAPSTEVATPSEFRKSTTNTYLAGRITFGGQSYIHMMSYDAKLARRARQYKVYLINGENKSEITQIPGTEYAFTAKQLGGKQIVVYDLSDEEIARFESDDTVDLKNINKQE